MISAETMPIEMSCVGAASSQHFHTYTWRDQALYSLGIGAGRDELAYLYEKHPSGMRTYPSYGVVPAFDPVFEVVGAAEVNLRDVVHGSQALRVFRPLPVAGRLCSVATIEAVYDLKRFATLVVRCDTWVVGTEESGNILELAPEQRCCETRWTIVARGMGGFGGPRPPRQPAVVAVPKDRPADWQVAQQTSPEQALLYRLSGDLNPLHIDPEVASAVGFEQGPILHGLCTFGYLTRAVQRQVAQSSGADIKFLTAQFKRPVWPGDVVVVDGWDMAEGRTALQVSVRGKDHPVVTAAWAEVG